ncbi:hypothetical protein OG196_23375 [Kitasatospora purpeofusca]|uniref:hypothetical protein n=1 Tax=Kitasatospora purpeofusca TaxID=67352 RepID=UPI002E114840|nr:hypothetical protein OG196_23375 [Kitasatospora purpeofusca]
MHHEWDNAHTDHTSSTTRPGPSGLAETEADWRHHLAHETPNGWLLNGNSMTTTLASGHPIHLMHTTVALDAIRASGHLYASTGCLVAALYCAPLTAEPAGLRPHNLGTYLLETKKHTRTLVFEITPDAPVPPKGIDYLRLGAIHLRTYLTHRSFLTEPEDTQLRRAVLDRLRAAAPFLDTLLTNAAGTPTPDAEFIDQLAATVPAFPFLGYLYFEVLSEYLMLNSTTAETKAYAQLGEMNNRLYKRLAFSAVQGMDQLFDLSRFYPGHERLLQLVGQIEPGLTADVANFTRQRLSHLFANVALAPGQDAASFTFQDADFDTLAATAPHLLGQLLFREMRITDRYPQLYLAFEQAKALEAWDYWNTEGIPTPFNGTIPKGEIGINTAYPRSGYTVWTAETCERGRLHPIEQLDVALLPRLAELGMTAMRRDKAGKAAGHLRRPV